jgi:uncharacterized protein
MSDSAAFIGRGLAFPLQTSATGAIAMADDRSNLEDAIRLIVATAPGERPMRPEFGCRIHDYVFAPIEDTTIGSIAFEVERAVNRWEPRTEVESVDVYADDKVEGLLYIDLTYRIRATNDERNLVFPFYTIPQEEAS